MIMEGEYKNCILSIRLMNNMQEFKWQNICYAYLNNDYKDAFNVRISVLCVRTKF